MVAVCDLKINILTELDGCYMKKTVLHYTCLALMLIERLTLLDHEWDTGSCRLSPRMLRLRMRATRGPRTLASALANTGSAYL